MARQAPARPIDLKRIEAASRSVQLFLAALRRQHEERWASPFAASGAKPPAPAPARERR